MLDYLRKMTLALNVRAQKQDKQDDLRRVAIMGAKGGPDMSAKLKGMKEYADWQKANVLSWKSPQAITAGEPGFFDTCDVGAWVALAERAGVPAIPAVEVLRLDEDEMSALYGKTGEIGDVLARRLGRSLATLDADGKAALAAMLDVREIEDMEALGERLYAAMDNVPEGWMVRHARAGASSLKALAGHGLSGVGSPETRFGSDLEVGPGWVRNGNRRRIDVSDRRVAHASIDGFDGDSVFVARPWAKAGRLLVQDDPLREDTPFAGKGMWPAEWRVFVENSVVIGVSSYYSWAGGTDPVDAAAALEAADMARRIVAAAAEIGAWPSWMNMEALRLNQGDQARAVTSRFPREAVSCSLDFMETDAGMVLLEGGPPHTPMGGGHPCGFAGMARPQGVALRPLDGVSMMKPGPRPEPGTGGCFLSWEEAEQLAASPGLSCLRP